MLMLMPRLIVQYAMGHATIEVNAESVVSSIMPSAGHFHLSWIDDNGIYIQEIGNRVIFV